MSSSYSLWFIPLCLLVGALYAYLLYGSRKGYAYPVKTKRLLFALRTLAVSLLCFLLLRPVLEGHVKEVEKPVIVLGIDNSESLLMAGDTAFYRNRYVQQLRRQIAALQKDYQVDAYLIGDTVRRGDSVDFSGKSTRLALFFEQMEQQYLHRNVGAVVCLSDGIPTEGGNPLYAAKRLQWPIYTVALGDTTDARDLLIARTNYNREVYRRNFFPMEILVQAHQLKGKRTHLEIKEKNKVVFEKDLAIDRSDYAEWVRLNLEASETGFLHYKVSLSAVEGERSEVNNTADVLIQVKDERHKVAIVYRTPHPDVAAVTEAMKDHPMFEVESFPVDQFRPGEKKYDMLVLHQLPSADKPAANILEYIRKNGVNVLYFTGGLSGDVRLLPDCGLQLRTEKDIRNDAYPVINANFADFSIPAEFLQMLPDFPPIQLPFGKYALAASAKAGLYQQINRITTDYPLFLLNSSNEGGRTATFIGEGWWRWRIYNYMYEGNHAAFDGMMGQVFQYLVTREDRSPFRVKGKKLFAENENVCFDAELYNRNYELVNQPEVEMKVVSEEDAGRQHSYAFSRTLNTYHLDMGRLPAGDYRWTASTDFQGKKLVRTGHFCVHAVQVEALRLTADHQLLQNIAGNSGGKMLPLSRLEDLNRIIHANADIRPVAHYNRRHRLLTDSAWFFCLLILLLGGEWFLRRWSGNY